MITKFCYKNQFHFYFLFFVSSILYYVLIILKYATVGCTGNKIKKIKMIMIIDHPYSSMGSINYGVISNFELDLATSKNHTLLIHLVY